MVPDNLQNIGNIKEHFFIRKTNHFKAFGLQISRTLFVLFGLFSLKVVTTINLDNNSLTKTDEIGNVTCYRMLSPEMST